MSTPHVSVHDSWEARDGRCRELCLETYYHAFDCKHCRRMAVHAHFMTLYVIGNVLYVVGIFLHGPLTRVVW